ncbi:hypothetical protein GF326_00205 [Candidatus Bathyarchaeota archaeon]|nr:hypothetical protein [Candidatus Bathyarchaeota archaeon]
MKINTEEKQNVAIILLSRLLLIIISTLATLFPMRTPYPGETIWTTGTHNR